MSTVGPGDAAMLSLGSNPDRELVGNWSLIGNWSGIGDCFLALVALQQGYLLYANSTNYLR